MFFCYNMSAQEFSVPTSNGLLLRYGIISDSTVELNGRNDTNVGALDIPQTVMDSLGNSYYVVSIANSAFARDSLLTSISIPTSIQSIGQMSFWSCIGLTGHLQIPNSVDTMGWGAFYDCPNITSITISDNMTVIPVGAFGRTSITEIVIPDSVNKIELGAFEDCRQLQSVTLPSSVEYIQMSFDGCFNLKRVYYSGTIAQWCNISWANPYNTNSALSIFENFGYNRYGSLYMNDTLVQNIIIPYGIEEIKKSTFRRFYAESVTIPSSVRTIDNNAFADCWPLMTVTIPDSVEFIGENAFLNVNNIVYHGNATGAPWGAKSMNGYIKGGYIYSDSTWHNIIALRWQPWRDLTIPESIESISSITFADSLYLSWTWNVNYNAHNNTSPLNMSVASGVYEVTFGDSVQSIPDSCFLGFSSISQLTLPASLTSIGAFAFSGCSSVNSITMLATTPPTISSNTFDGVPTNADVVVPCGSLQAYMADPNWSRFTNIHTVGCPYEVSVAASDTSLGTVTGGGTYMSGDTVVVAAFPTARTYFNGWSNGVSDNPYSFIVASDTSLTALFQPADTTYIDVHDTTYVDVHDTTYIDVHDTTYVDVFVHDTTYIDVHDTTYIDVFVHDTTYIDVPYSVHDTTYVDVPYPVHDTTYVNVPYPVHDTTYVNVPYPVHDTTYVNVPYPVHDTTYVNVPYPVHDTTYVDVPYPVHDTTIVTDTLWLTHYDTVWLHDTIIIHDTIYITQEGIDGAETVNAKVYSSQGQIVVEGAGGNTVTLYDVSGRMLAAKHDDGTLLRFDVPTSGTYMIKIGHHPARKVVVIR